MKVKIDTKEKFHVLKIAEFILSANMTEELHRQLLFYLEKDPKNVVLKMNEVNETDASILKVLQDVHEKFYKNKASFVICELNASIKQLFNKESLTGKLNITATESEAWDIVQFEEIEREYAE